MFEVCIHDVKQKYNPSYEVGRTNVLDSRSSKLLLFIMSVPHCYLDFGLLCWCLILDAPYLAIYLYLNFAKFNVLYTESREKSHMDFTGHLNGCFFYHML